MNIGDRVIAKDPETLELRVGYICGLFPDGTALVADNPRFCEKDFYDIRWAMAVPMYYVHPLQKCQEAT